MGLAWNICAPLGTLSTFFFNPVFQVSTAKNEINLFNNHVLIVAPVIFAPAGAMTPSAEFLFLIVPENIRAVTIQSPHDTICISLLASQYDTYHDTFFSCICHSFKALILLENRFKTISEVHSGITMPVLDDPVCHTSESCISVTF